MKKIFVISFGLIFLSFMIYIVFNNNPNQSPKALTVLKDYSYTYNTNTPISIEVYLNNVEQALMYKESYESVSLKSGDDNIYINTTLASVNKDNSDEYLKETYHLYKLKLYLPKLDQNIKIDDAYININLINGSSYLFKIGRVSLFYEKYNLVEGNWTNINVLKDENSNLSRIKYINITLDDNSYENIEFIYVNLFTDVIYNISNNILSIEIPYEQYLLNEFTLIISVNIEETFTIANYQFIKDFKILSYANHLINLYETN